MEEPRIRPHHYTILALEGVLFALAAAYLWQGDLFRDPALYGFIFLVLLAEALPVELPQTRATVSVSFPIIFAAGIVLGPFAALVVGALGTLNLRQLLFQAPWVFVFFNRFQLGLAAAASAWIYGYFAQQGGGMLWGGLFLGGAIYFAINVGSVTWVMALYQGVPFSYFFRRVMAGIAPAYIALIPMAYVMAAIYTQVGYWALLIFFLPLFAARESFRLYSELRQASREMVVTLARTLEVRDPYTAGHSERVAKLAVALGRKMGLSQEDLDFLNLAGLLHDIGKVAIPDAILGKTGALTEVERHIMQLHPGTGYEIIKGMQFLGPSRGWVLHHHERWDGEGYPSGLDGEFIPIGGRILAVADSVDAMLSDRPYRKGLDLFSVCQELVKGSQSQFDGRIVKVFLDLATEKSFVDAVLGRAGAITLEQAYALTRALEEVAMPQAAAAREPSPADENLSLQGTGTTQTKEGS
ncbi:MAG: HD domain-containing protein [Bacillota bacterium]|nr:HD domain-containing protein [Bacillota bacterium]